MKTMKQHPLIRELELGRTVDELIAEHFTDCDFSGPAENHLPQIIRELVNVGRPVRFAVLLTAYSCEVFVLDEKCNIGFDYWDYRHSSALDDDAHRDCGILNEITEKLFGIKRKSQKPLLTPAQFVQKKGKVCPFCLHGEPKVLDEVTWTAFEVCGCPKCGQTWRKNFKQSITGFSK
jgi:hypothetical protein